MQAAAARRPLQTAAPSATFTPRMSRRKKPQPQPPTTPAQPAQTPTPSSPAQQKRSSNERRGVATFFGCAALLAVFAALAWFAVDSKSPTYDEPLHAVGAWLHLHTGD